MKAFIYHAKPSFRLQSGVPPTMMGLSKYSQEHHARHIVKIFNDKEKRESSYTLIACIETCGGSNLDSAKDAFRLSNDIDGASWEDGHEVIGMYVKEAPRSTSVGDVIFIDGDRETSAGYLVAPSGFIKIIHGYMSE